MNSIQFLSLKEAIAIHQDQINRFGGIQGIRDAHLIDSAMHSPQATFGGTFLHATILEMAAAYMYGITQNHPFLDGNKRTGLISGCIFLELNGYAIKENIDLYEISMATARGETSIESVANFFKDNTVKITAL